MLLPAKREHCARQTNSVAVFLRNGLLSEGYTSKGGAVFLTKSLTGRQNSNHSCHQFLGVLGRTCGCSVFVVPAKHGLVIWIGILANCRLRNTWQAFAWVELRLLSLRKQWQRNINTSEIHGTPEKDIPAYSRNVNTPEMQGTWKSMRKTGKFLHSSLWKSQVLSPILPYDSNISNWIRRAFGGRGFIENLKFRFGIAFLAALPC